jgi:hypothetical protein
MTSAGPKEPFTMILRPPPERIAGTDHYPLQTTSNAFDTEIGTLVFVAMESDSADSAGMSAVPTGIISGQERIVGCTVLNNLSKTAELAIMGICTQNTTFSKSIWEISVAMSGQFKVKFVSHLNESAVRVHSILDITHAEEIKTNMGQKRKLFDSNPKTGAIYPMLYVVDGKMDPYANLFSSDTVEVALPAGTMIVSPPVPGMPVAPMSSQGIFKCRQDVTKLLAPLIAAGKHKEVANTIYTLIKGNKLGDANAFVALLQVLSSITKQYCGRHRRRLLAMDTVAKNEPLSVTIIS